MLAGCILLCCIVLFIMALAEHTGWYRTPGYCLLWVKKSCHYTVAHNFAKCWPI